MLKEASFHEYISFKSRSSSIGDNGQFSVTNDGKIVTKLLLDRETKDSYSIVVNVTDYGAPPLQVSLFMCSTYDVIKIYFEYHCMHTLKKLQCIDAMLHVKSFFMCSRVVLVDTDQCMHQLACNMSQFANLVLYYHKFVWLMYTLENHTKKGVIL